MAKAWIFQGGWDGHEPVQTSARFAEMLRRHGFEVEIFDTQKPLESLDDLMKLDLLVFCWTMGEIPGEYVQNISKAVASGVGITGCHGGMCDAFRQSTLWQFITGGQWVAHPGGDGIEYTVNIRHGSSPIVEGLQDFKVCSEQYYLHVDPAIEVLATTRFPVYNDYHTANKPIDMPVAWTKFWGNGRVFYSSLGHHDAVFEDSPNAAVLMERGMLWAAEGKRYALEHSLTTERFEQNTGR